MKKLLITLTFNLFMTVSVHAGTIGMSGLWNFEGQMIVVDSEGLPVSTEPVIGDINFDSGIVNLALDSPFFGPDTWYSTGTITDQQNGSYLASLEMFRNSSSYSWSILWEITQSANTASILSLDGDGDGDGLPGTAITEGPFPGFTQTIDGTLTNVPLPATAWLFISGLIGLAGVAGHKQA